MLALLSSPVRRWLLASILLPVVVVILRKAARFIERRHADRPTRLSRLLARLSDTLARFTSKARKGEDDDHAAGRHARKLA